MCDYSLHSVVSRPAKVGDKLMATSFHGTLTHGFAAVGEPYVAVCLLPGTELAVKKTGRLGVFSFHGKTSCETAVFRQIDKDRTDVHHDALEFPDERLTLLTHLSGGLRVTVLQLPASSHASHEAEKQLHATLAG